MITASYSYSITVAREELGSTKLVLSITKY